MLADKDRIFTNLYGQGDWHLAGARARGAWQDTKTFVDRGRDWITNEVKGSGLRGRGGAGFPTALKWTFMPKVNDGRPHQLLVNADESEPGTCKDREILRHDPQHLVEGCLLAGRAMDAHIAYIYVRGEFIRERQRLEAAVQEAYDAKLIGKDNVHGWDFDIVVHHGAGAYVCGEETALMESLEGKKGQPRLKPPFPAAMGVYGNPTTVNNVEFDRRRARDPAPRRRLVRRDQPAQQHRHQALQHLRPREQAGDGRRCDGHSVRGADRQALRRHPRWLGQSAGRDPRRLVDPVRAGRQSSATMLMDFDGTKEVGSSFGTAAVIVMDKSTDIIRAIWRLSAFYKHESCGQCTPCREGMGWMMRVMERMVEGRAQKREIDMLFEVTKQIEGHTICAFADGAVWPIQGLIRNFRPVMEERIDSYTYRSDNDGAVPSIAAE